MKHPNISIAKTIFIIMSFALTVLLFGTACSNDDEENKDPFLTFIGDSEVARWDVKSFFPEYQTVNKGRSGAVVAHIEKMKNAAHGTYAIIILGTNNVHTLTTEMLYEYADRYMAALAELNGKRTFVFSIFPRSFAGDAPGLNTIIKELNAIIKEKCLLIPSFTYLDVYHELEKDDGINPEYSYDGLHLSKQGYELITWILKKNIK
jgi:lysophospholipase L1-like esterase